MPSFFGLKLHAQHSPHGSALQGTLGGEIDVLITNLAGNEPPQPGDWCVTLIEPSESDPVVVIDSTGQRTGSVDMASLSEEYIAECKARQLPPRSAEDLLHEILCESLICSGSNKAYLEKFSDRWDRAERAAQALMDWRTRRDIRRKPLHSPEDVQAWLKALHVDRLLWHMDDDPFECFDLPHNEIRQMATRQSEALDICRRANLDIFGLYPDEVWDAADRASKADVSRTPGRIEIKTGISDDAQAGSFENATMDVSGVPGMSVSIAAYAPYPQGQLNSQDDVAQYLREQLQELVARGWAFEIQIGEIEN